MRKHLLAFLSLLLFTYLPASAQKALFLDTTNQWLMVLDYTNGDGRPVLSRRWWVVFDTPAVYNDLEYTVINAYYRAYDNSLRWQDPYCFREDTVTGTVYIKMCDSASEEIVYMRNDLDVGDTLAYYGFLSNIMELPGDTIYLVTTAVGYDTFINRITNLPDSVRYYTFDLGFSNPNINRYYYIHKPRFSFLKGFDIGPVIQYYHTFENDIWRTYCFWNQYSGSVINTYGGIWDRGTGGPNTLGNIYGNTPCADIQLSVREQPTPTIWLYPNPAVNMLHITGVLDPDAEITVLSSIGQVLIQTTYTQQLDISPLPDGLYLLRVSQNGNPAGTAKFWKSDL